MVYVVDAPLQVSQVAVSNYKEERTKEEDQPSTLLVKAILVIQAYL